VFLELSVIVAFILGVICPLNASKTSIPLFSQEQPLSFVHHDQLHKLVIQP
jgi:hypothetical protein